MERGGDVDGKSYASKVPVDSMKREMNRLFGVTLSDDEMHIDADDGLPDNLEIRATVQDGYLYFNEMHGFAGSPIPAIVSGAEDLGDNTYCLTFEAYVALSYNGISSPLISDVPESVYGLPADQLKSTIAGSAPMMSGTAVVKVTADDGAPSFTLQSSKLRLDSELDLSPSRQAARPSGVFCGAGVRLSWSPLHALP